MTTAIQPFRYDTTAVRSVLVDDAPWFVVSDIAKILGYRDGANAARLLRPHQQGYSEVSTPSGIQRMLVCNEGGVNRLIMRSNATNAEAVQDWFTDEVLPAIRRTGTYSVGALDRRALAEMVIAEADRADAAEIKVADLEPKAAVAEKLLDADGDYSVRDAAQALTRAGIKVGQTRLFNDLEHRHWIARAKGDGRFRVMQSAIESGHMSVIPASHYHPKTGVLVLDPPQPRITPKGLQKLLSDYGAANAAPVQLTIETTDQEPNL